MSELSRWAVWTALVAAGLAACGGDKTDSALTDQTDTDTDTDPPTDTDTGGGLSFTISGNAIDLSTGAPVPEGLCALAFDPDPAVLGGDVVGMSTGTVGAGGAFTLTGLDHKPQFGILLAVNDCDGTADTGPELGDWFIASTPIPPEWYLGLEDGSELPGMVMFGISTPYKDGVVASLTAAGYPGNGAADGLMFGFVADSTGVPIDGATVVAGPHTVFYQDADPSDGLFSTGVTPNTATMALAGGVFVIPGASTITYRAVADGYEFTTALAGVDPERALILPFLALP